MAKIFFVELLKHKLKGVNHSVTVPESDFTTVIKTELQSPDSAIVEHPHYRQQVTQLLLFSLKKLQIEILRQGDCGH
ncbi:hypothetical protein NPIL_478701 [Nephila pilipes]|uniref:Uncharacterized protein n=1 Tax=Nephila pilipes TaxID=299642 RepID=A0A8X6MSG1_NEPPI|nr:hypothetical protein NPIL_478701 [Nephila pilipes]